MRAQEAHQRSCRSSRRFIGEFYRTLLGPFVSSDNHDVLAIRDAFEWRSCHRQFIARHFHLISPSGADPRLHPSDLNVEDDLVTFDFINTAPREHALEKLNTFRVRG